MLDYNEIIASMAISVIANETLRMLLVCVELGKIPLLYKLNYICEANSFSIDSA